MILTFAGVWFTKECEDDTKSKTIQKTKDACHIWFSMWFATDDEDFFFGLSVFCSLLFDWIRRDWFFLGPAAVAEKWVRNGFGRGWSRLRIERRIMVEHMLFLWKKKEINIYSCKLKIQPQFYITLFNLLFFLSFGQLNRNFIDLCC